MKLAILYAGQGSQHPGMGKDLYERYPAFREAFNAADLDFDLESVCFDDPEGVLNLTQYTQPCMVAFAAGVTAVLKENGVKADDLAGLSLGEYSALEAAGVFTAKQAVELAAFRGKAMADAAKGIECGMTAVMNLDRDALAKCCEEASALGCVQICNYNCPGQLVIGGEKAAVEKAAVRSLTLLFRMVCITVPLMLCIEWLLKNGAFNFWEQYVPDQVNRFFPAELVSVVAAQMGGLVQSSAVAANLRAEGLIDINYSPLHIAHSLIEKENDKCDKKYGCSDSLAGTIHPSLPFYWKNDC